MVKINENNMRTYLLFNDKFMRVNKHRRTYKPI